MCEIWLMIGIIVLRSSLVCPMVLRRGEFMAILICARSSETVALI